MNKQILIKMISKPSVIAIVGDVNSGKTMLLYHLLDEFKRISVNGFSLYTYGLKLNISNAKQIYTLEELEQIKDSVIVIDEVMSLFDLDDRKSKKTIENTLRLIHHNNNILFLCFIPENIKKFIAGKLNMVIMKKVTFADLINGSTTKHLITSYKGMEAGSSLLNLSQNEAIIYDGQHYTKIKIPYLKQYDTKSSNKSIIEVRK